MSLNILPSEVLLKSTSTDIAEEKISDLETSKNDSDISLIEVSTSEIIPIELIPDTDSVHRCLFDYPYKENFISNQFQHDKGLAMSVFWNKYSNINETHCRGDKLCQKRSQRNSDALKYLGFTQTIVNSIRQINFKNDSDEIMYFFDVIHCPDDGLGEVDVAHAHIQILDKNSNTPIEKLHKNHRMSLIHDILDLLNKSELISKP